MNHRIIHIESELRQERHLMTQSEIVELETELQQLQQEELKKIKREFIADVYDNLMKNTKHNPIDFSKSREESWFDCAKGEIHIGNFVLSIKEQNNEPSNWHKLKTELQQLKQGENNE